ncbi:MAG: hypothetical protein KGH56_01280 [Patescibacteria group bacterium]|nr:hypothetical protein [Patescibacteria group bacterium]
MTRNLKQILQWPVIGLAIVAAMAYGATWFYTPQPQTAEAANDAISPKALAAANPDCEGLQPNVTKAVDDYNKSQKLKWSDGGATFGPGNYLYQKELYKVLYSPGLSECIAVVIDETLLQEGKKLTVYEESYGFYDATTYEYKDWIDVIKHSRPYYSMADVAQKIHKYETATSSPVDLTNP